MPYTKFSDRIIHKLLLRITNLINVQISFGIGKIILKFGLKEIVVVAGLNWENFQTFAHMPVPEEMSFKDKFFIDFDTIDINTSADVYENA